MGYERQAERGYDCRVLGDGCLGRDWVVHMRGQEGMQSTYHVAMCLEAIHHGEQARCSEAGRKHCAPYWKGNRALGPRLDAILTLRLPRAYIPLLTT